MKEIIKLTYGSNEDAKQNIDEGTFRLRQMEGRLLFLPEHWNLSVRPWQCVEIRLDSQEEDTDSDSEYGSLHPPGRFGVPLSPPITAAKQKTADAQATMDSAMIVVKYRIDFHSKSQYTGEPENFLYSKTWDAPVVIQSSNLNGESDHVLEEIHHIILGKSTGAKKKDGGNISDSSLILGPGDTVQPKRLHIRSSLLLNALRSLIKYSSNDTEPLVDGMFAFPFKELYHHRAELLEYQNGSSSARANHTLEDNDKCDRHISVLLDYLDKEPTVQLQSVKNLWAQKVPTTTFAGLWLLLKPGSDVYITEYGQLNACVLELVCGGMDYSSRTVRASDYEINVWYLVFDGKVIKRKSKVISVPVFDGEREIMSLPIFPTYFRDQLDGGSLRHTLIERGEKFFCYAKGPTFLEYSGSGLKQGTKKVRNMYC
ncbi:uncharacterized protein J4E92_003910 [Alternaria infectoria]|uniref:uncharacterized protein n=1 Tax=Alternaria infectoria TaxID=45303 RepID=UPI00221E7C94|nr:uncharacterized protein J4E92_003910 [Alternaria infectoria]KAI4932011.1 hypothetical protein J4E92_003910 [Alternaria infectoria]